MCCATKRPPHRWLAAAAPQRDRTATELFEGKLEQKGRQELLGPALEDFHAYLLEQLEPRHKKHHAANGWGVSGYASARC